MSKEYLIALMLINKVPQADIVCEVCRQFDIEKKDVEALIHIFLQHPLFDAAQSVQQELNKRDWLLEQLDKAFSNNNSFKIDVVHDIEEKKFYENYYRVNRPLVIKGLTNNWPAIQQWTFETLKNKWGNCSIEAQFGRDSDPRYDQNHKTHSREMLFKEYLDLVINTEETNDFYMTSRNMKKNEDAFEGLLDEIQPLPPILDSNFSSTIAFLWVGPKGAKTQLHHDMSNNLHTQIIGKKRFRLASPFQFPNMYHYNNYWSKITFPELADLNHYPLAKKVQFFEVVLEPGDTIFIPVFWWHCVESLTASVSVAFHNFKENNRFEDFDSSMKFSYHQDA